MAAVIGLSEHVMGDQRTDRESGGGMSNEHTNIIEEHVSPDHFLRLIVTRDPDGDISIGFDRYMWHTHGDILAATTGLPISEAIRQLVGQITSGDQIIAVSRVGGIVCDVWPTEDPLHEFKYKPPEESIEFRRWSGEIVQVTPPNEKE